MRIFSNMMSHPVAGLLPTTVPLFVTMASSVRETGNPALAGADNIFRDGHATHQPTPSPSAMLRPAVNPHGTYIPSCIIVFSFSASTIRPFSPRRPPAPAICISSPCTYSGPAHSVHSSTAACLYTPCSPRKVPATYMYITVRGYLLLSVRPRLPGRAPRRLRVILAPIGFVSAAFTTMLVIASCVFTCLVSPHNNHNTFRSRQR